MPSFSSPSLFCSLFLNCFFSLKQQVLTEHTPSITYYKIVFIVTATICTVAYDGSEQGNLVKYGTRKDWKAVINILFKIKEVNVLPRAFQVIVSQEVKEYCNSMNVFKKTSSDKLEKLSNASIVEELESHCCLWFASV